MKNVEIGNEEKNYNGLQTKLRQMLKLELTHLIIISFNDTSVKIVLRQVKCQEIFWFLMRRNPESIHCAILDTILQCNVDF